MLTIVKPQKQFQPELGDFLFASEFIHSYVTKKEVAANDFFVIPLIFMSFYHPFTTLKKFNIDAEELHQCCKYDCPFREQIIFYGLLPIAIKTDDSTKYRHNGFENTYNSVFDLKWQKNYVDQILSVDQISKSFLGHGFTDGTLPFDGNNSIVNVKLQLSNNDFIIAHTWEWYNK